MPKKKQLQRIVCQPYIKVKIFFLTIYYHNLLFIHIKYDLGILMHVLKWNIKMSFDHK